MAARLRDAKTPPDNDEATVTPLAAVTSAETSSGESLTANSPAERKRKLTRVQIAAILAFTGFAVVLGAIESLAVRGQSDFGHYELGLTGGWTYTVAVALEAGSLTFAGLALWATLSKDRAPVAKFMTTVMVMAAAGASWTGGRAADRPVIGAAYLAAASVMALLMWHEILHRLRREELRATGSIRKAAPDKPRFGWARWLIDFRGTWRAWKVAVLRRISDAEEALDAATAAKVPPIELAGDVLAALPARDRLAVAFGALGRVDVPAALAMLRERGAGIDQSYAYKIKQSMTDGAKAPERDSDA